MDSLEPIKQKIYEIRGQRVMQDRDLAELYQVTTGNLNKAVKRNIRRFPHLHPMTKKVIILNAKVIKKSQLSTKNNEIPTKMRLFP